MNKILGLFLGLIILAGCGISGSPDINLYQVVTVTDYAGEGYALLRSEHDQFKADIQKYDQFTFIIGDYYSINDSTLTPKTIKQ